MDIKIKSLSEISVEKNIGKGLPSPINSIFQYLFQMQESISIVLAVHMYITP